MHVEFPWLYYFLIDAPAVSRDKTYFINCFSLSSHFLIMILLLSKGGGKRAVAVDARVKKNTRVIREIGSLLNA
jgi:Ni,Fe-hydrogenase III component G